MIEMYVLPYCMILNSYSHLYFDTCRGGMRMQKLKTHMLRTQSSKILPFEPGAGLYMAMHAVPTAMDFSLVSFYPSGPFTCIFPKPLLSFSCVGCG